MPLAGEMSHEAELFGNTASLGFSLSKVLEEGRGEKPLTQRFQDMQEEVSALRLPFSLVGFGPNAVEHAMNWLYGHELFRFRDLGLPDWASLLEVTISGQAFGLKDHRSHWVEAEGSLGLRPLAKRIFSNAEFREQTEKRSIHIRIPDAGNIYNANIAIVLDRGRVLSNPAQLLRLVTFSHFLVIATPWNYAPSEDDVRFLKQVLKRIEPALPIAVPGRRSEVSRDNASGKLGSPEVAVKNASTPWLAESKRLDLSKLPAWLRTCGLINHDDPTGSDKGKVILPAVVSGSEMPETLKRILNGEDRDAREAVIVGHQTKKIGATLDAVTERFNIEVAQVARKQAVLQIRAKELEEESKPKDYRDTIDAVQRELDEGIADLIDEINNRNRRYFAPEGEFMKRLTDAVLSLHDLDEGESTAKAVRLMVPEDFVQYIKQIIRGTVKPQLHNDILLMEAELGKLKLSLKKILSDSIERTAHLDLPPPNEEAIWDSVNGYFSIDIRSRGEIPKATVMQALSGGRRWVYPVLIMVMLLSRGFGMSGGMASLGPWILVLFVIGIVASYFSFKKERQETVSKELVNVREGLLNESKRLLGELQREKYTRLTNYLNDIKRKTSRTTTQTLRSYAEERALIARKAKQSVDARLMHLRQQDGRLQEVRAQLDNLKKSYQTLEQQRRRMTVRINKPDQEDKSGPVAQTAAASVTPKKSAAKSVARETVDKPGDAKRNDDTSAPASADRRENRAPSFAERYAARKTGNDS